MDDRTKVIRAVITRIRYNENSRVIAEARVVDAPPEVHHHTRTGRSISILGSMIDPAIGQEYELSGKLSPNIRFGGTQMNFVAYVTILPQTTDGIIRYLVQTGRWCGPATARILVAEFGDKTLDIIKTDPSRVHQVAPKTITVAKAEEMQQSLLQNEQTEKAAVEVAQLLGGVLSPHIAAKAVKKWGSTAPSVIKDDAFRLMELRGVGFRNADIVYLRLGGDENGEVRHAKALIHALYTAASTKGHTLIDRARAIQDGAILVGTANPGALGTLRPGTVDYAVRNGELTVNNDSIAIANVSAAENYLWNKLETMIADDADESNWGDRIDTSTMTDDQKKSIEAFKSANVFVLTGAPGTGKTYTTARIIAGARAAGVTVAMGAPTGKAAKQMNLALGSSGARTIHSLLEPTFDDETGIFTFSKGVENPIDAHFFVIDEFSMVDTALACSLLSAIRGGSKLLIVGDHYQLPSVGPGAVLRDLLAAGIPSYELTEIQRNAGRIVRACHQIKDGHLPSPSPGGLDLDAGENWRHIETGDIGEIKRIIELLLSEKLADFGLSTDDMQIISPTNETGPLSCLSLNRLAKGIINPGPMIGKLDFGVGDRVVRCKNGEVKGRIPAASNGKEAPDSEPSEGIQIVNGDIGILTEVGKKTFTVHFSFPDRIVQIPKIDHHLKAAYCMTCHKMQGSEVPVMILPVHASISRIPMVTREWLYTAMSRAQLFVVTVGTLQQLAPIVNRIGTTQRTTGLQGRRFATAGAPDPGAGITGSDPASGMLQETGGQRKEPRQ